MEIKEIEKTEVLKGGEFLVKETNANDIFIVFRGTEPNQMKDILADVKANESDKEVQLVILSLIHI